MKSRRVASGKVVEDADAGELGRRHVFGAPLDRSAAGAGGLDGDDGLARGGVGLAQRFVVGAMLRDEVAPCPRRSAGWWSTGTARLASSTWTTGSL